MAPNQGVAPNQNTFIVHALEEHLARLEEPRIDAEFAQMAEDESYRTRQLQIAAEFAQTDWEVLQTEDTLVLEPSRKERLDRIGQLLRIALRDAEWSEIEAGRRDR